MPVGEPHLTRGLTSLLQRLDQTNGGGFSGAPPSFPSPSSSTSSSTPAPLPTVRPAAPIDLALTRTLDPCMATGGIHDQIAGGFHRYSVDRVLDRPALREDAHDNAQLARTYTAPSAVLKDKYYAGVARPDPRLLPAR
ncbi:MAG: hypothetical protein R3B67_12360 [Phycisphaerales bacterium]